MGDGARPYCNHGCDNKGHHGGGDAEAPHPNKDQRGGRETDDGGDGTCVRWWDAEIAETHGSEGLHEGVHPVKQQSDGHGWDEGKFGEHKDEKQRDEGERQEESEERDDEDVDRQSNRGDAVEIDGHGESHEEFDRERRGGELEGQQQDTDGAGECAKCHSRADQRTQGRCEHAQDHAKFRDDWRE